MRALFVAALVSLALAAAPLHAQTPGPQTPPPQPAPAPPPPMPFPEGAKVAFVNLQRVANESTDGKAATSKVQALNQLKVNELNEKNKALQASQQKLAQTGGLLSDTARSQLERDIERMQIEIQRFTQDAQADVQDLQQQLQVEFQNKLLPVIGQVATEKGLHMVFSTGDAGIVWANGGLDITNDVIKRFDQALSKPGQNGSPQPND